MISGVPKNKDEEMKEKEETEPTFIEVTKDAIEYSFCNAIKFCYGYLFGSFMWSIIIQPYNRFYNFERGYLWPEFLFAVFVAFLFMSSLWIRNVMVLFLPSMVGNASQNYIIIALLIALFSHPLANLASNTVESVRVIGCSLSMTFEQLKERAKLLLNPIVEVLRDTDRTDLVPIKKGLLEVKQVVDDMVTDVKLSSAPDAFKSKSSGSGYQPPQSVRNILNQGKQIPKWDPEFAKKAKQFLGNDSVRFDFDFENLSIKAKFDSDELRNFMRSNITSGRVDINLTEILYENCLTIFRRAKLSCEEAVEDLRLGCQQNIGPYFAALWCSPVSFSLSTSCPWIMNQILDENNLCQQMNDAIVTAKVDPFNVMGNSTINDVYRNLTNQIASLNQDLVGPEQGAIGVPKRLELNIALNSKARDLFLTSRNLYRFISDKYKMRKLFLDILMFIYELYTTYTFFMIIRQAYKYHTGYRDDIKFDNHYITGLFVEIDQKRRASKKSVVLPLSKDESDKYITAFSCKRRTSEEKHTQQVHCTIVIVFLVFTLSVFYLDDIFYSILMSIHQHAMIRIKEIGSHKLDIKLYGEGSIARLVRRLTQRLNSVYDLKRDTTTQNCLPDPKRTSGGFYLQFLGLVLGYIFIDQISIYAMRFRRLTAAYFYPDKEKQRTIYLYNSILVQRQRIQDAGLNDFTRDDKTVNEKFELDDNVYTAEDALRYLGGCISDSLACNCYRNGRN